MFLLIASSWLHRRTSALHAGVGVRNRDLPVLQWRRWREASDLQDLLLVEGLPLQQSPGERLELLAVLRQQPPGLLVALIDDRDTSSSMARAVSSL